jgi:hypothetical protein
MRSKQALLFEKRSKNFGPLARVPIPAKCLRSKGFLVLFCKKEPLASRPRQPVSSARVRSEAAIRAASDSSE